MVSDNGLLCFTNALLVQEDGSLAAKDLWVDTVQGVIVDTQTTFFQRRQRPTITVDLKGNILSPGFLDIQINGAYDFDFSVFDGDEQAYTKGLNRVAANIVETGVTSLVPTIITQSKGLYPTLLRLLQPRSQPHSAHLLGWHAEGPFLQPAKRGAHDPSYIVSAPEKITSFEAVYGAEHLTAFTSPSSSPFVRIITAAPEVSGVLATIPELTRRGVNVSIGHSIAASNVASEAVAAGARLITHLFNAMPQLHHRDPGIIGLLGTSPALTRTKSQAAPETSQAAFAGKVTSPKNWKSGGSEALEELPTPPDTPALKPVGSLSDFSALPSFDLSATFESSERPFYGMIVDGIHCHPNSVRLAYTAHSNGCILITDAMKMLDPHMKDGVYDWRDGKRLVKHGVRLFIEDTDTLAGSVVTMDTCVRNFANFTGCTLGEAIRCATYNPARSLRIEDRKGTLRPGADGDLVMLDRKSGRVLATWVKGKQVWKRA